MKKTKENPNDLEALPYLLAIDPGISTGWAVFNRYNRLVDCGLSYPPLSMAIEKKVALVVIERPVIYPKMKARPNDIVALAINAGEYGGCYGVHTDVKYVKPFEWKGQVPKEKHQPRIWARLDATETAHVHEIFLMHSIPAGKQNNVIDAIGLGLWATKRMSK